MIRSLPDRPLCVTLVDQSDLVTAGLKTLLEPYAERVVLLDNREALAHPELLDVVLFEPLSLTGTAEAMLRDLRQRIDAPTVVFSWAAVDELPTTTARPYLSKNLSASGIVVRIEEVVAGRFHETMTTGDGIAPATANAVAAPEVARVPSVLTPRETEIIALIVAGMSNREIGDELTLSVNSVKTYIRTAYRKMGVARRTQAMRWALEHGIGVHPDTLVG